jgi:hypothetical protein
MPESFDEAIETLFYVVAFAFMTTSNKLKIECNLMLYKKRKIKVGSV